MLSLDELSGAAALPAAAWRLVSSAGPPWGISPKWPGDDSGNGERRRRPRQLPATVSTARSPTGPPWEVAVTCGALRGRG